MSQYAESTKQHAEESAQKAQASATAENNAGKAPQNAHNPYKPPIWAKFVAWPEAVGVWAVILTLFAITWQSIVGRQAAEAALLGARSMQNAERAWMIASIEGEVIPNSEGLRIVRFSVRCRNNGKTPAFLLSMKNNGVVLPREQALPEARLPWNAHNVEEWPGDGIPIQPGDCLLRHNYSTVAPDLQDLLNGSDWLWVYGEVIYLDAFGNRHETRYCFLWDCVHDVAGVGKGTHFLARGPASYIRAT